MSFFKKLWNKVNGSKTKIGAVLVLVGKGLQAAGISEGAVVEQVGTCIAGLGLTHAASKALDLTYDVS